MSPKSVAKDPFALPEKTSGELGPVEYVEVVAPNGQVAQTPVRLHRADAVRARLAELGLTERDVRDAVTWARETSATPPAKGRPDYV